ncbi:HTH-type transcriptional regulator BetI [Shimia sp. SK013]|uniref:TetR/AcrR family transcriptional regulator n=1 Tax=Shimia sp. SK013 TaxID=1389006 RepID=UPI0006B5715B|nr:TetR/AcrR family transcriptional regulator [Shimia sp. SK013]KPA22053.1 HTH-type transcriptional regulator BetI [Shimia sp. SK013]
MTLKTPKKSHHHGDLRNALIKAGIEILEEGGIDALSLRKCAARAGVSHAAPAHHFDGLPGLKGAIASEAFAVFSRHMLEAAQSEGDSPQARLKGICRGYVQFGLAHRALLDTIFGIDMSDLRREPIEHDDSSAYQILRDACAPFVPDGTQPEVVEFQVWSLIHGYTMLFVRGHLGEIMPTDVTDGPFEEVMALLDRVGTAPKS